jgi:hypothetical protein
MIRLADVVYTRWTTHRGHNRVENSERRGSEAFVEDEPHSYQAGTPRSETYNPSGTRRRLKSLYHMFP